MGKTALKDIYLPEPATVVSVRDLTPTEKYFEFKIDSGRSLGHLPGQFAEISIPGMGEAPISISTPPEKTPGFGMGIRRAGSLTGALHALDAGAKIGVRGPFGTAFPVKTAMQGKDILFVCAGIGMIPLRSAITYVLAHRKDYGKVFILSGTRTPAFRLFADELAAWSREKDVEVLETVDQADDSWKGNVGVITTLFPKIKINAKKTVALIVGPPVMYKFALLELRKYDFPLGSVYVSLERHMKCGVGKCGHCQINGLYTCQDGPVFRYSDIAQVREAI
jgi:sulfhydrogenase subunit gamma (sulfur reductase)